MEEEKKLSRIAAWIAGVISFPIHLDMSVSKDSWKRHSFLHSKPSWNHTTSHKVISWSFQKMWRVGSDEKTNQSGLKKKGWELPVKISMVSCPHLNIHNATINPHMMRTLLSYSPPQNSCQSGQWVKQEENTLDCEQKQDLKVPVKR